MKGHQKILLYVAIVAFIVWVVMLSIVFTEKSEYSSLQEACYVGEKIIQNSEETVYEYEYEFKLDSKTIYYHSHKKMEFESKERVIYRDGEQIIVESQLKEQLENCKNAEKVSRVILLISVVILVAEFFVEEKVIKK